ncbi:RNA polymerase sigma factor [Galbibacter sp. EGI 63066]|uniref:RNA polymerase sigma factor n=1 Tax=Galbibacter sp. EGI 63066 TaxID=2993559 RepID=UPI00224918B2|nr:RNA polymerase sigma factor [Galbibacter sp. EGI 63066]MCX2678413.1 RNA polymerase sigma factor [Galbibacter sp. EGI 63066]
MDDGELVAKIVATNNTHLFSILYDRYAEIVYHKCLSFSNSVEEAQDLTHDIFVQLFIKLRSFKGKSKFSTWLYSFTYNFCVNYVQRNLKKRREKFVSTEDTTQEPYQETEIDDKNIYEMKSEKLSKALKLIEPADKMVLMMKYQDDMSIKEIQKALDIGLSATKMRLNRAKGRLIEIYNTL